MSAERRASVALHLIDRDRCAVALRQIEVATPRLSEDEIARAASGRESVRWSVGRIALRLLLEERCGQLACRRPYRTAPGGRLSLDGCDCDFSIADTGAFVLIGIATGGRIGVDIEGPRTLEMPSHRMALVAAAGAALGTSEGSPLQNWTRIEAFAKATGPTLAAALARLGVQGHREGTLSPGDVGRRAALARSEAGLAVVDLALPDGLVGAAAATGDSAHLLVRTAVRVHDPSTLSSLAG